MGGGHLEGAIASLRESGRIAWVGAVAQYNTAEPPPAPRNLFDVVGKSLRLEGVLVRKHVALRLLESVDLDEAFDLGSESWLCTEAAAYDALKADPSRAIPAEGRPRRLRGQVGRPCSQVCLLRALD